MSNDNRYESTADNLKIVLEKMNQIDKKMNLCDCAMATIFKLLRINYALIHQDEIDKQSIFLAGFDKIKEYKTEK